MMKPIIQKIWMVMAMLCLSISASAYDFEVDGIYFTVVNLQNREVEVSTPFPEQNYTLKEIKIPAKVAYDTHTFTTVGIGKRAFSYTDNLQNIYLPASIKTIGKEAFMESNVEYVYIYDGLEVIGESAFEKCYNLNLTIPKSVNEIGSRAFLDCHSLSNEQILSGSIGVDAFKGCTSLEYVDLSNVTDILSGAFYNSAFQPQILYISPRMQQIGKLAIQGVKHLVIEDSTQPLINSCEFPLLMSMYLGRNTDIKCDEYLRSLTIGSQVTKLAGGFYSESKMFENATSLDSLIIKDSDAILELGYLKYVKPGYGNIGQGLFYYCPLEDYVYVGRPLKVKMDSEYGYSPFVRIAYNDKHTRLFEFSDNAYNLLGMNFFHSYAIDYLLCGQNLLLSDYVFSNSGFINNLILKQIAPIKNNNLGISNYKYLHTNLVVPNSSMLEYKQSSIWGQFFNINPFFSDSKVCSITSKESEVNIEIGSSCKIDYQVKPSDALIQGVYFWTENPNIVNVDENGVISALSVGNAILHAKPIYGDGESYTWTINVSNTSGLAETCFQKDRIQINVKDEGIEILGKSPSTEVQIFDLAGVLVKKSINDLIYIGTGGFYIVKVGSEMFKIKI